MEQMQNQEIPSAGQLIQQVLRVALDVEETNSLPGLDNQRRDELLAACALCQHELGSVAFNSRQFPDRQDEIQSFAHNALACVHYDAESIREGKRQLVLEDFASEGADDRVLAKINISEPKSQSSNDIAEVLLEGYRSKINSGRVPTFDQVLHKVFG